MPELTSGEYTLIPTPGLYIFSANDPDGNGLGGTVTFVKRHGETGYDETVETDGTALELNSSNPSAPVYVESGVYIKPTSSPTGQIMRAKLVQSAN